MGVEPVCTPVPLGTTPHPDPPPQGGRESKRLNLAPMRVAPTSFLGEHGAVARENYRTEARSLKRSLAGLSRHPPGLRPLALNTGAAEGAVRNLINALAASGCRAFVPTAAAKDVVS